MDQDRSWVIRTSDLKVGTTIGFDLVDRHGGVVLKAGTPFTEPVRNRLLASGIDSVTIMVMPERQSNADPIQILDNYEPESVRRLQSHLNNTQQALASFFDDLKHGNRAPADELRALLDVFFVEALRDTSVVLGMIADNFSRLVPDSAERLTLRATRLSWLAMVSGIMMDMNASDTVSMGLAGALHDVSLLMHPEWLDPGYRIASARQFLIDYQRHPIESAEILAIASGLGERLLLNVTQVHEQMDGSGYPRGLRAAQILPAARVLNTVDAYQEVVDPLFGSVGVVPADALAHLCLHATQGVFDREAVQALIQSTSLYPIGSLVELSDSKQAIVIRSNPGHPLQPVVRILEPGHTVADLRNWSASIRGPVPRSPDGRRRITKREMQSPLWDGNSRQDVD